MSCSETCWLLGGVWFQCRYGGFWMSSCQLMFPGVRSFLVFSSFGLKPPASGFLSYSYSSLKTPPSIPHSFWREWAAFLGAWCPLPVFRRCFVEFAQHSNDLLMSSCLLMFPGIRNSLVFSSFGFKPPASGFQSYSYSGLKASPALLSKRMGCLSGCLVSSTGVHKLFCGSCSAFKWLFDEFQCIG